MSTIRPIRPALRGLFTFALAALMLAAKDAQGSPSLSSEGIPAPAGPLVSADLGVSGTYRAGSYGEEIVERGFSPSGFGAFNLESRYLDIVARLSGSRDGKYGAALADIPGGNFFGIYFLMEEGGLRSSLGPLSLEAGHLRHYDIVESPYSLFVNSNGISSDTAALAYNDGFFFFGMRWIGLNHDSAKGIAKAWPEGFPERGATIKTWGLRFGEMRFGMEDAVVYTGRWFDYEYFLNPLPLYFSQYLRCTGGMPWTTNYDDNNILGFFWDWKRPGQFSLLAQLLVDDIGLSEIFPSWPANALQAALSLGGRLETVYGSFGLYAAMATKYSFGASQATAAGAGYSAAYGYSYYPDTQYDGDWQNPGTYYATIAIEDNALGYKYGENNFAIQADWKGQKAGFELGASLEFRLMGTNSPANPWQDYTSDPQIGSHWLDESVLEKRFMAGLSCARELGPWQIKAELAAGLALDALELRAPTSAGEGNENDIWIYAPVAGNTKGLFSLSLGVSWHYEYRRRK